MPTRERLKAAKGEYEQVRARMIALQEELDWDVYHRYGLITDDEAAEVVAPLESIPDLRLGQRAFEIVLGRKVANGETQTQWFSRHPGSQRIKDIPGEWPDEYRAVVAKRIELIEQHQDIGLIERPEFKRRWLVTPWEDLEHEALRDWLLDRCEERSLWFGPDGQPRPLTIDLLADALRPDADVVAVARLYAGDEEADLADVLEPILRTEHVPYRAGLRYKASGSLKRKLWEKTWDLQREEDAATEDERKKMPPIPVPPKYSSADFQKSSYWKHRGKLDVPKERFISYPDAAVDRSKKSLPLGWAGWDHREQAYALISLIEDREASHGWESDRVRPLVEGLAEAMPWVRQWHTEPDESGESPATAYDAYLAEKRTQHGVTE